MRIHHGSLYCEEAALAYLSITYPGISRHTAAAADGLVVSPA